MLVVATARYDEKQFGRAGMQLEFGLSVPRVQQMRSHAQSQVHLLRDHRRSESSLLPLYARIRRTTKYPIEKDRMSTRGLI